MNGALAYGRLLRLSLAPSALADVAAGTVLGAAAWPAGWRPFALMLASACVYHGGMALNDWADRAEDARGGRGRPLATGAIAPASALALALLLLGVGPLVAWSVAPRCGFVLGAVAACAALYDLVGRGAWTGPLLLGACRAGNLGVGLALASTLAPWRPALSIAPLAYGTYVFLVSRLARLEDVGEEALARGTLHPARWTVAAASVLLGIGMVGEWLAAHPPEPTAQWFVRAKIGGSLALAALGAFGLFHAVWERADTTWRPADVGRTAGMALRRLLVATATLAAAAGELTGIAVALAILCGYPVSFALRKVFPPT